MSTPNTALDSPLDETHSSSTTPASSNHRGAVAADIYGQTTGHAASSDGLENLEKPRAQVEAQLNSVKDDIKSALASRGAMEAKDKEDLQQFQDQITELEDYLEVGKKVDLHRQSPPPAEDQCEQSLQATNTKGGLEFYEDLGCMAKVIAARVKTWKASLPDDGAVGENESGIDSRDTADTESGNNTSQNSGAPTHPGGSDIVA